MLNEITASCLVTQLLEMGAIKLGMYLTSSIPVPFFDLVAFTGYKYLKYVICVAMIGGV
jgi:protein transport protein YIF1